MRRRHFYIYGQFWFYKAARNTRDFRELTGKLGDARYLRMSDQLNKKQYMFYANIKEDKLLNLRYLPQGLKFLLEQMSTWSASSSRFYVMP